MAKSKKNSTADVVPNMDEFQALQKRVDELSLQVELMQEQFHIEVLPIVAALKQLNKAFAPTHLTKSNPKTN